jgi:hypothetical protein
VRAYSTRGGTSVWAVCDTTPPCSSSLSRAVIIFGFARLQRTLDLREPPRALDEVADDEKGPLEADHGERTFDRVVLAR